MSGLNWSRTRRQKLMRDRGVERYFVALVMSAVEQFDEANNTMKLNTTLEIDSNIVRVAAAAA